MQSITFTANELGYVAHVFGLGATWLLASRGVGPSAFLAKFVADALWVSIGVSMELTSLWVGACAYGSIHLYGFVRTLGTTKLKKVKKGT